MLNILSVQEKIKQFYLEDNHYGDLATSIFDTTQRGTMNLIAKESGIFCGEVILHNSFTLLEPEIAIELYIDDGDQIQHGQHIAKISGKIQTLLTMERIVLNLIQRMSGIATKTHQMVELIQHTSAQLVDTRKTTPGLGMFEKYAVRVGGGVNHRRTLNDGIMLKDNHLSLIHI